MPSSQNRASLRPTVTGPASDRLVVVEFSILALSMVMPSLLLLWYFHSRDAYPEPASVVWRTFGLGVLSAIPVLMFALPMGELLEGITDPFLAGLYEAFVLASIPEEVCKLAVILWYARRHSAFDEPMDGLVYGVAASLGFATLENVLYVAQGGLGVAMLRAVTSIPGHATFGAIMGYYVGQAHFSHGRTRPLLLKALLIPILLHGVYDAPLMIAPRVEGTAETIGGALLLLVPFVLIISVVAALRMSRGLRARQLAEGPMPRSGSVPLPTSPTSPSTGRRALGVLLVLVGGLLATAGALIVLGVILSLVNGVAEEKGAVVEVLVAGLIAGVLPVIGGVMLFRGGTRQLNGGDPSGA